MRDVTEHRSAHIPDVALRASDECDLEFLFRVYAASRAQEMAAVPHWSEPQKEEFLRFQFRAQHKHYRDNYPDARYDVITCGGEDIGRLYVDRMRTEIRVMDIALLPEHRNRGIGSALMQELLDESARDGKIVSLHVEEFNPAKRLYERMGFVVAGEVTFYKLMHWTPPGFTAAAGSAPPDATASGQVNTAS